MCLWDHLRGQSPLYRWDVQRTRPSLQNRAKSDRNLVCLCLIPSIATSHCLRILVDGVEESRESVAHDQARHTVLYRSMVPRCQVSLGLVVVEDDPYRRKAMNMGR